MQTSKECVASSNTECCRERETWEAEAHRYHVAYAGLIHGITAALEIARLRKQISADTALAMMRSKLADTMQSVVVQLNCSQEAYSEQDSPLCTKCGEHLSATSEAAGRCLRCDGL